MDPDLRALLRAFNDHKVRYLVVGAYAVGVHAEPRATKDLDIWIKSDPENSRTVYRALAAFGAPLADVTPTDFNDEAASVFQIGQPPFRVDILQRIDAVEFDAAWDRRVQTLIDGDLPANVISEQDLVQNKLATGRPQDLVDAHKIQLTSRRRERRPLD